MTLAEGPGTVAPQGSQTKAICKKGAREGGASSKSEWVQGPGAGRLHMEQEALVAERGHSLRTLLCAAREVAGGRGRAGHGGEASRGRHMSAGGLGPDVGT